MYVYTCFTIVWACNKLMDLFLRSSSRHLHRIVFLSHSTSFLFWFPLYFSFSRLLMFNTIPFRQILRFSFNHIHGFSFFSRILTSRSSVNLSINIYKKKGKSKIFVNHSIVDSRVTLGRSNVNGCNTIPPSGSHDNFSFVFRLPRYTHVRLIFNCLHNIKDN